jgi:hypothetical protein
MWGTDNPPGQKDPYSRASPEELKRLWAEEERLQNEEAQAAAEKKAKGGWLERRKKRDGATAAAAEDADAPANVQADPVLLGTSSSEDLEATGYVPAQTWDGLPRLGGEYTRDMIVEEYMREHPFEP